VILLLPISLPALGDFDSLSNWLEADVVSHPNGIVSHGRPIPQTSAKITNTYSLEI
jgi:hypothetical protein